MTEEDEALMDVVDEVEGLGNPFVVAGVVVDGGFLAASLPDTASGAWVMDLID